LVGEPADGGTVTVVRGGGRVTIRDVARHAGVSTTTVSDALGGRGRLTAATRERIAAVARELGYSANPSARNLRRGRTGAIGLYFPERVVGLEYYMELAMGAAEEALAHELALTLIPASGSSTRHLGVDGVVVSDPVLGDPTLGRLVSLGAPVVTCERDLTPGAVHAGRVESDHGAGVRSLLEHLVDRGARTVALLCPGDETSFGHDIRRAYVDWCTATGRPLLLVDVPFVAQPEDVAKAVAEALGGTEHPDALVSVPDGGAASALQAATERGRRVPDDLLVASYVDSRSLRGTTPPITAVDIAPREMGRRAARLLADLIDGRAEPGTAVQLTTAVVPRGSTSG
jgi:DNA-binding LacI/PurR family transcriptional regulator